MAHQGKCGLLRSQGAPVMRRHATASRLTGSCAIRDCGHSEHQLRIRAALSIQATRLPPLAHIDIDVDDSIHADARFARLRCEPPSCQRPLRARPGAADLGPGAGIATRGSLPELAAEGAADASTTSSPFLLVPMMCGHSLPMAALINAGDLAARRGSALRNTGVGRAGHPGV